MIPSGCASGVCMDRRSMTMTSNRVHNYCTAVYTCKTWALQKALLETLPLQNANGHRNVLGKIWIGKNELESNDLQRCRLIAAADHGFQNMSSWLSRFQTCGKLRNIVYGNVRATCLQSPHFLRQSGESCPLIQCLS